MAATPPAADTSRPGILERSLAILSLFTEQRPDWRVPDIAEAVDLPVPTAYRLVSTLMSHGLLRPTAGGYRLGSAALDLGRRAAAGFDLSAAVGSELQTLAEATQETCVLSVLDEAARVGVCVDRVDSAQPLRLSVEVGERMPLHAGAASKALLAFCPASVREAVLGGALPRLGPGTLTSSAALAEELDTIRAAGYAVSREETDEGAWGVAAPIRGAGGVLLGSIGMAGPLVRCTSDALESARIAVLASARRAESVLGA